MDRVCSAGTGVAQLTADYKKRLIELNDEEISYDQTIDFFIANQIKPVIIEFSMRETRRQWGTAFYKQSRIILYRHSVGTFLHELAHIELFRKIDDCVPAHGLVFAKVLEHLIRKWNQTAVKLEVSA